MKHNSKISKVILLNILILLIIACATVPLTGRRQLRLIPSSNLMTMSLNAYQDVLKNEELSKDAEQVAMVRRVGQRLAAATELYLKEQNLPTDQYKWEFNVIDNEETVNAWCMPGGKIAVYTGILPITKDENGLAVVMGHEIAHAMAEHGNERMSQELLVTGGAIAVAEATKDETKETKQIFMLSYGALATVGALLPYSRLHESEADRIGLNITAMAGYDPRGAIPFWQRMGELGGGKRPPEFLSTHPHPDTRIKDLEKYMPEAMRRFKPEI
jgi:predicted Zn-dependent protease